MSLKNALRQSRTLTFAILFGGAWTVLTMLRVYESLGPLSGAEVGQRPISGVIGIGVMFAVLGVLLYAYGELAETEPRPESWPPER